MKSIGGGGSGGGGGKAMRLGALTKRIHISHLLTEMNTNLFRELRWSVCSDIIAFSWCLVFVLLVKLTREMEWDEHFCLQGVNWYHTKQQQPRVNWRKIQFVLNGKWKCWNIIQSNLWWMKIIAMENEFTIFTISSEESADETSFILFPFSFSFWVNLYLICIRRLTIVEYKASWLHCSSVEWRWSEVRWRECFNILGIGKHSYLRRIHIFAFMDF